MKKYIVLEGIHGSGKTTLAHALADRLHLLGYPAQYYHFPDETDDLGKVIRKIIADKTLVYQREITGLLYASFANIFHTKTAKDNNIYITDRHSVTTGLVFQQEMSRTTRQEIYGPSITALQDDGVVFSIHVDKTVAHQRMQARNQNLFSTQQDQVRHHKAQDQFTQKFDEMTDKYEQHFLPQARKLNLPIHIVHNNSTIDDAVEEMVRCLEDKES